MWVAKINLKHDCILGNRCEKFKVTLQSVAFSAFKEGNATITSSMHHISGEEANIQNFLKDLEKDKDVIKVEKKKDMFFLLEKAESKAVTFFTPKIIFIKPVVITPTGYERWEIGSWEKDEIVKFINKVERKMSHFEILKLENISLDTVFFPKLMPALTSKQKRAVDLAIENGYYITPRKTNLRKLARIMGVSLATFEQHIRAAENKLIPDILTYSK